jgi:hypothetical protein
LDILGGQRWDRAVEDALETCHGMIVVLTPDSLASNNVMDEVSYALEKKKMVVPVLLQTCEIPFRLRRVQHIDLTADYETGFSQLLRALHIEAPPQPQASAAAKEPFVRDFISPSKEQSGKAGSFKPPSENAAPLLSGREVTHEIETQKRETQLSAERRPREPHQTNIHMADKTPETPGQPHAMPPRGRKVRQRRLTYAVFILAVFLAAGAAYWGYRNWHAENTNSPQTSTTPGLDLSRIRDARKKAIGSDFECRITERIGTVNVRSGPGAKYQIISQLKPGELVYIKNWTSEESKPNRRWLLIAKANTMSLASGWIISRPYTDRDYECNFDVTAAALPFPEVDFNTMHQDAMNAIRNIRP